MAKKQMPYVIVRSDRAGVFAGLLESRTGSEVVMREARRLWRWSGAATLSELAMCGTKKPEACKFPCVVQSMTILGVIEILTVTEQARTSIEGVPVWSA